MSEATTSSVPPCKILFRSKDGIEVFDVSSDREHAVATSTTDATTRTFLVKGETSIQTLAPDGSCAFVLLVGHGVVRVPLSEASSASSTSSIITKDSTPPFLVDPENSTDKIQMMAISPQGNYLVTWQRVTDTQPNNLKVWCTKTGKLLVGFPQKGLSRAGFPYVHWTADEAWSLLMTTNEVRVYPGRCFADAKSPDEIRFTDKIRVPGITTLSVPDQRGGNTVTASTPYRFTTFVPGDKNKPAKATLHEYTTNNAKLVTTKSLFQAEDMKTNWSPNGSTALITLQTSVDTSGKSYYGSASLFLLGASPTDNDAKAVPLPQDGPVMDVSWMPNATKSPPCFVVIAGRMPAMASMHHGITAEPLFLFGNAHRNAISWAPHGRFVNIAGFGNLAGGMSFWDRNKLKLLPGPAGGQNTAACTVGYGWSPDSRLFGVSTTTPRMNVDNGYRLFRYTGEEIPAAQCPWKNEHYMPNKLLEACFVPALPTVYPDRPQSPNLGKMMASAGPDASQSTAAAPVAEVKKPTRYIPPSQRGKATGGSSFAERMRREQDAKLKGAQVVQPGQPKKAVSVATGKVIPGLVQADPDAKSKSALKREKQKLAKQRKEEEEAKAQAESEAKAVSAVPAEAVDPEKRARKIKKTLKQIDELKDKKSGGTELNEDQQKKVDSETSLLDELKQLGL